MLNVPEEEADVWIAWGTHVYRDVDAAGKVERGRQFEAYLHSLFDRALAHPGEDFFSYLNRATFKGRPMTREEAMGIANLAFAGGRDTVINAVTGALGYFGGHPEALEYLRQDPKRIVNACEELFRYISPLTHIGRVCPVETDVMGVPVQAERESFPVLVFRQLRRDGLRGSARSAAGSEAERAHGVWVWPSPLPRSAAGETGFAQLAEGPL